LDLYAGTGAVGIEAVSRGAREAVLVEVDRNTLRTLRDNVASLEIADEITVVQAESVKALGILTGEFDVVFLDPPYSIHGQYEACLSGLSTLPLLAREAIVVAEHDKRFVPAEQYGHLHCYRRLFQGDAGLSFYAVQRNSDTLS
jgi:16S rRNA (guanine(966)-N(2))-methyltransferase RsmD